MKDTIKPIKKQDLAENEKEITEKFDPKLNDVKKSYWDSQGPIDEINNDAAID